MKLLRLCMLFTAALLVAIFCGSCSEDSSELDEVVIPIYVVSFESNGGSSVDAQSVEENGYATQPTDPTRENYIFEGWYSDSSLSTEWSFSTQITADITLYAAWSITTCTVTFEVDGGSEVASQEVDYGSTATKPEDPTKETFNFVGWYADAEFSTAFTFEEAITSDTTIYAKWSILTSTVTFEMDGGSEVASQVVEYGEKATKPEDPTKETYNFDGWYADAEFTTVFTFEEEITTDVTIYAKWSIIINTVTFEVDGGSEVASQEIDYGSTATKPEDPTKEGYNFVGWYADAEFSTLFTFEEAITTDTTIYAKWAIVINSVTFEVNGGSEVDSQVVEHGDKAIKPEDPTKEGYNFDGWYADAEFTTPFTFEEVITSDTTIYAKWSIIINTVTFEVDGGSEVASQQVEYGSKATKPADPTKDYYDFDGWYADAEFTTVFTFDEAITSGTVIYAKWLIHTYTVSFVMGSGTAVESQTIPHGSLATEPTDSYYEGYYVSGWYTDAALTEPWDFATAITSPVTLYATWEIITYTVTFASNGGSAVESQVVVYNNIASSPAAPSREGYTFDCWCTDTALTSAWTFNTIVTSNMTLYAKWIINTYTVSFVMGEDSATLSDISVDHGSCALTPTTTSLREGYYVSGWYTDAALTEPWSFATPITTNVTLYATWEIITYAVTFATNGGSPIESQTIEYGNAASTPAATTREGYTFDCWCSDASLTSEWTFSTIVTSNMTLYAKWIINTYAVNFVMGSGTAVESQTIDHGSLATEPTDSYYEGYYISGWYTDAAFTEPWSFETPITAEVTLYATWEIIKYSVTFNSNEGSAVESQTIEYGNAASTPAAISREGYSFVCWCSDAALTSEWTFSTIVTDDMILYAKWLINTYTVSFEMGADSATLNDIYVDHGSYASTPTTSTLRTGYYVSAWYTDAALTEPWSFATAVTSNLTLYAVWTAEVYTVNFEMNGGDPQAESQQVSYSQMVDSTKVTTPTKSGYDFAGWFSDATFTTAWDLSSSIVVGNVTLYAKWVSTSGGLTDMGTGNIW